MSKKKFSNPSDLGEFVFSTSTSFELKQKKVKKKLPSKDQKLEALLSRKGRGGKTVTIVKGFKESENDLKILGKTLKTKCGVGGSVKNGEIIIQGRYRDKIMKILQEYGYNVKRVGG